MLKRIHPKKEDAFLKYELVGKGQSFEMNLTKAG
jgi:hypothetical protein